MINNKTITAIIPARGGSKGLKRKNIKLLSELPLIAYSIIAAKNIDFIDNLIVSTEDKEIAEIAQKYGADVPFMRPKELADDNAKTTDLIIHAAETLKKKKIQTDIILLLQPTSPLREKKDIIAAFEMFKDTSNAKAVVSVCEVSHSPLWTNTLPDDLLMDNFIDKNILNKNRQQLQQYYRINGAIYIADYKYFIRNSGFHGKQTYAYIMPPEKSIDIDNILDFKLAEIILKQQNGHK